LIDDKKQKVRLGIIYNSFPGWVAFANYISNLIFALKNLDNPPEIIILKNKNVEIDSSIKFYDQIIIIPEKSGGFNFLPHVIKKFIEYIRRQSEPHLIDWLCSRNNIDVVFSHSKCKPNRKHCIPWITWIPDFQHNHFPNYFNIEEITDRNRGYKTAIQYSDCIIVSSQSVYNDLVTFFPKGQKKCKVVPFVSQIDNNTYIPEVDLICEKYNLPQKYFYLPNQFWIHKNHKLVIDALSHIHKTHPEITVVCSGNTNDYRNNSYFSRLLLEISMKDLRNNFIVLGLVPRDDVFQLMRQSCAVLQPSLFEGWSTTVEEAKSLGKRLLLSDIPVHREQNPLNAIFFNSTSKGDLANKMIKTFQETTAGPDQVLEKKAQENLHHRTENYGLNFMNAIYGIQK